MIYILFVISNNHQQLLPKHKKVYYFIIHAFIYFCLSYNERVVRKEVNSDKWINGPYVNKVQPLKETLRRNRYLNKTRYIASPNNI